MTAPLIELCNVSKKCGNGRFALEEISLAIEPGEAVAVLGPSGSGKSALLNMMAGLDHPTRGTVMVDGVQTGTASGGKTARHRQSLIGMIFQCFSLFDDLTVLDNVLLPARLSGMSRSTARDRADELLDLLHLAQRTYAYPARLSAGEQQRVAVARALINRPALLLADEPAGALDAVEGKAVRDVLIDFNLDGQTLVVATRDIALARACAMRVVRLLDGRVIEDAGASAAPW